jgi:hypothetical protein
MVARLNEIESLKKYKKYKWSPPHGSLVNYGCTFSIFPNYKEVVEFYEWFVKIGKRI